MRTDEGYVLSRRERKKRDCKYAILKAARELIVTQGLDVLIEDIANRADISYPTFYNYFPTKASLYYAIYQEEIEDISEFADMELQNEPSAAGRIARLFDAMTEDFKRYRYLDLYIAGEVARHTAETGGDEQLSQMFRANIERGVATGEFRSGLDAGRYALLIAGILLSSSFYDLSAEDCRGMLSILIESMRASGAGEPIE